MKFFPLLFLILLPSVVADEFLSLQETDKYQYTGEKWMRPCATDGRCDMTLLLAKYPNATKNTLTFSAMIPDNGWKYVSFDEYVSNLSLAWREEVIAGNGSSSFVWNALDPSLLDEYMNALPNGSILLVRYTFTVSSLVDIVPTFAITETEERTYEDLAIFFPGDVATDLPVYFPFDSDEGAIEFNKATTPFDENWTKAGYTNLGNGLLLNNSNFTANFFNNASELSTTENFATRWSNDTLAVTLLAKQLNPEGTIGLVLFLNDGTAQYQIRYYANTSWSMVLRDNDAVPEIEFFFPPFSAQSNVWNFYAFQYEDFQNTTIVARMYINGTQWGVQGITVDVQDIMTTMNTCSFCGFNAPTNAVNGYMDEIRMYARHVSTAQLQSMTTQYFTQIQHNISFTDGLLADVVTPQFVNRTVELNFTNSTALTFTVNSPATLQSIGNQSVILRLDAQTQGAFNITLSANSSFVGITNTTWFLFQVNAPSTPPASNGTTSVTVNVDLAPLTRVVSIAVSIGLLVVAAKSGIFLYQVLAFLIVFFWQYANFQTTGDHLYFFLCLGSIIFFLLSALQAKFR